jgi:hypothetical protein
MALARTATRLPPLAVTTSVMTVPAKAQMVAPAGVSMAVTLGCCAAGENSTDVKVAVYVAMAMRMPT